MVNSKSKHFEMVLIGYGTAAKSQVTETSSKIRDLPNASDNPDSRELPEEEMMGTAEYFSPQHPQKS